MAKLSDVNMHDRVGMDLAKHAGEQASRAVLNALSLCDSPAQGTMIVIQVLGIISAQAAGVISRHVKVDMSAMTPPEMLELVASLMREAALTEEQ